MSIEVSWDNEEKSIMLICYPPRWEWDEIYLMANRCNQMIDACGHLVVVIHDMHDIYRLPPNAFEHVHSLMLSLHPHVKMLIFVGMRPLVRVIWNTFAELYSSVVQKRSFYAAENIDEARLHGDEFLSARKTQ